MARTPGTTAASNSTGAGLGAGDRGPGITRESLERDLAAFRKAGGRIEVLGNNRTLSASEERELRRQRSEQAAAARVRRKAAR